MSKINIASPRIVIEIDDLVIGDTIIKQKAAFETLIYNQKEGAESVAISWQVLRYAKDGDQYGVRIDENIQVSRQAVADNTTMADVTTGQPVQKLPDGDPNADENGYPSNVNYAGQYDVFFAMGEQSPIVLHTMIRSFGQAINF